MQDRFLAEIVADDARHVGVDRLVVGNPGADRVGERHIAGAVGAHQPAHPHDAIPVERLGVEKIVVNAAIDHVDAGEPAGRAHPDAVVLDHQIRPFDQRHAHLARQKHMLEIGRVVGAGRQQHDLRLGRSRRRDLLQGRDQPRAVIVDWAQADVVEQVGKGAQHHVAVLDDVADPRRGAGIVFEHEKGAVFVAHDVGAADVDIGLVRQVDAAHVGPVVRVAEDQVGRDDAVRQHVLVVVDVVEQQVDRGDALDDAAFEMAPFRGRQHPRQHVERQDAVDRLGVGIDRKGDAEIVELGIGGGGAFLERLDR